MGATRLMEKALFSVAKKWIAGDSIDDALQSAKISYKNGRNAIINKLGEYHKTKKQIEIAINEYEIISSSFRKWGVKGAISVKPTQVGLSLSRKFCLESFQKIIENAAKSHTFVWIDMESADHTDETLDIYYDLFSRYERLGVAIQSNLKRSEDDLEDLIRHGAKIRLVKGAYRENQRVSFKTKIDVDKNFEFLMENLFRKSNEFGIATHDLLLINKAKNLALQYDRKFEFQLLKGIRDEIKPILNKEGFTVSDYIPYGTNWLPYSIRRIKERKRNLLLLGSSLIRSGSGSEPS